MLYQNDGVSQAEANTGSGNRYSTPGEREGCPHAKGWGHPAVTMQHEAWTGVLPIQVETGGHRVTGGVAPRKKTMKSINDLLYLDTLKGDLHFGTLI